MVDSILNKKGGYIIAYRSNNRRVRINGELTPYFEYAMQGIKFIEHRMDNSPYVWVKKVK